MNKLPIAKRVQILSMLCEGSSMRSIRCVADVSINTVSKLLEEAGEAALAIHDETVHNVRASRMQCDEIWSFCNAKERKVAAAKAARDGDVWTWTALDTDIKLIVSYFVGDHSGASAIALMDDLCTRLANRVQLTTDGHKTYLEAVEGGFGGDVDYAQLVKLFGAVPESAKGRYSTAESIGAREEGVEGTPDPKHVSISYVDGQKPDYVHEHAPIYPADERLLKEAGQPHSRSGALLRLLQLLPRSQVTQDHARDSRWHRGPAVVA